MKNSLIYTIDSWYILIPAFLLFLIYMIVVAVIKQKYGFGQFVLLISFAVYFLCMIHLVFFPIEVNIGEYTNLTPWYKSINFIPVLTIDAATFILNIIMLVPLGMYLPLLSNKYQSIKKAASVGLYISLSFEVTQLLIRIILGNGRSTDINDLIANTLGAVLGFLIIREMSKISFVYHILQGLSLGKRMERS
ncbi:glycopeptide antibiotics resistance protein [Cytobacillus eiseniae]|uniref:Glycopeptide antibiotics resistance protein n=1 Tax=Cytobacillus eiseniae TaxID=762947 RepID=A0ABS4RIL1_9BACI|nr:VanZ family protein [Cytobacillus eiseniae]MBP2242129.1 glycopeptide antibiotics resistance protein [Cytobacillus eiseniae]